MNRSKTIAASTNLTFILGPDRIYVQTRLQTFFLQPLEPYWKRRMLFIGTLMELGEVRDLDSLAYYCGGKVLWVPTSKRCDNILVDTKEVHMSLIQGYNGKEVHKENGKLLLKDGDKTVGTYDTMADLVAANPRSGKNKASAQKTTQSDTAKTDAKTSSTSSTGKTADQKS